MKPALGSMRWLALLSGGALLACASRGVEVREYVLTPVATSGPSAAASEMVIGVGPVRLPRYLRRTALVTRIGDNELRASDLHRWGEELDRGLTRVVAENLEVLLPGSRVEAFPWSGHVDVRVAIDVQRFEPAPDGSVVLEARWRVMRDEGRSQAVAGATSAREPPSGSEPVAAVGAMSRAAARLSHEIAGAIRAAAASPPAREVDRGHVE